MPTREISEGRKILFYIGGIIAVVGFLTFGSVFVSGALNFGNFDNFEARGRSMGLRAIGGMGLIVAGMVLQGIGRVGLAGSGVVLDPQRARKDIEPWSRMQGGILKDTLGEAGLDLSKIGGASVPAPVDFDEKLRKLHQLHQDGILSKEEYEREKAELLANN
ncbi:MAG: SHOCT domain-containing protein [Candidatus Hydrogenedentes bacterium]|nr:SHOCT domain-containing protein [Candidatus Hydrogenedentota bacterium]